MHHATPSVSALPPAGWPVAQTVLVVGGANMDVGARTDRPLLAGDSTPGHIHHAPGGVGRNIAENLARLGVAVQLATLVGDDAFGAQLVASTAAAGVDMALSQRVAGLRTATYLSLHGPDGDMALAVNDMAILDALTPNWCADHLPAAAAASVLLLDCNLPAATLAYLLAQSWGWGVQGAWYAMLADLTVRAVLISYRFWHGGWKRIEV